jgi:hypothetical protein
MSKVRIRHRLAFTVSLASLLMIAGAASVFAASSEADFKIAYAAAQAATTGVATLRNQWTVTEAALAEAKAAAAKGDFDLAIASAREAEALAKASIFQAENEKEAWQAFEIR